MPGRCRDCMWWDNQHPRTQAFKAVAWLPSPGICRKHKPGSHRIEGAFYIGVQPFTDADDFCGEFREDKG